MRPFALSIAPLFLFCVIASPSFAQGNNQAHPNPAQDCNQGPKTNQQPAANHVHFDPTPYRPACSTEHVNGNCVFSLDRGYPITSPTFQMRRGSSVTVYVFHPFDFEALTLDAGPAQAYQGTDQAAALIAAAIPIGKGASLGIEPHAITADLRGTNTFMTQLSTMSKDLGGIPNPPSDVLRAQDIKSQLNALYTPLTEALVRFDGYFTETEEIYALVREIESPVPRPFGTQHELLRAAGVDANNTPDPWSDYPKWRDYITPKIKHQGTDTTYLLNRLPGVCQDSKTQPPVSGLWLADPRPCPGVSERRDPHLHEPFIADDFEASYKRLEAQMALLPRDKPDQKTYETIQNLKAQLDSRKEIVSGAIGVLPALIASISPNMETLYANIRAIRTPASSPKFLGVIPPPTHSQPPSEEDKILATYKALAPGIPFTINAQNEVANSLFSLPAATQKQLIATITLLYAEPRFEGSAGVFFSLLPNRTFANYTDTTNTGGVAAAADVRIDMTKTIPPLVIPFVAANYRISPEFHWLGGRRGAVYATAGIALNPYNAQVEYAGGFSLSWRYLIFGPLFHLGRAVHLTQGEQVGELWCQYGNGASSSTVPPACGGGAPPAPSTKMYWRGAFAVGIGVRVPTTYNSTNH